MQDVAYVGLGFTPDDETRAVGQALMLMILRADDGKHRTRDQLLEHFRHIDPEMVNGAVCCLHLRGLLSVEGDIIQANDSEAQRQSLDNLSAVVVHVLVSEYPGVLTVAQVAKECERDLNKPEEREEIELALQWIMDDGLAVHQDAGWSATRPAFRAAELSF